LKKLKAAKKKKKWKKIEGRFFEIFTAITRFDYSPSVRRGALFSGNEKNTRHNNRPVALVGSLE